MSDFVNRQDIIEKLRKHKTLFCKNHIEYSALSKDEKARVDEIDNCIAELVNMSSAELEQKWIPVTKALPKNSEFVLLTICRLDKSYSQIPFISVGYVSWNQSVWWCAHDGDCDTHNVEVLAWMPLPEPYRGDR